jgi:hypothetical protein
MTRRKRDKLEKRVHYWFLRKKARKLNGKIRTTRMSALLPIRRKS